MEDTKGQFMEKCKEYLHSDNFKELSEVSLRNKGVKGKTLGENLAVFEEGLDLFVEHLRTMKNQNKIKK